jgi:hypothetical protein
MTRNVTVSQSNFREAQTGWTLRRAGLIRAYTDGYAAIMAAVRGVPERA